MAKRARTTTKRKPKPTRTPRVVIVGFGRVGGALALNLKALKWDVTVLPRSTESVRRAASLGLVLADHDALRRADVCLLAVPDGAVALAAAMVNDDLGPTAALVHCSGALPLTVFGLEPKRAVGSFHPLVAISDAKDTLAGHAVAVAANDDALTELLKRLARALELTAIDVPETGRAAYHAGAVLSAGLLVSLLDAAVSSMEGAGLERDAALHALLPLMRSALAGVSQRGLNKSLTGPVVRGDVDVVQAHLAALPVEIGAIYRLLSRRSLQLTPALPDETRAALARLLA